MNLSDKTSLTRLYSRHKYSDGLPLLSDDLHNEKDLALVKTGLVLEEVLGSGVLQKPKFRYSINNDSFYDISLDPTPVNLNGDIFIIGTSKDTKLSFNNLMKLGSTGTIVLVCWYAKINTSSKIYEYGGLQNKIIENDLTDNKFYKDYNTQPSFRYQIRWSLGFTKKTFDYSNPYLSGTDEDTFYLENSIPLETGSTTPGFDWNGLSLNGKFYVFYDQYVGNPSEDGNLYILPLGYIEGNSLKSVNPTVNLSSIESVTEPSISPHKVWYNPNTDEVKMYFNNAWRDVGGSSIINVEKEPTGDIKEGTIWYNSATQEFKIYIKDLGFVETYAKMGFVQLQATHVIEESVESPQNITIPIPIDTYLSSDLLRVTYEGIELIKDVNYTLNQNNKTITLTDFTVSVGDLLVFVATRLVSSSDLMTTLDLLQDHMNDIGSSTSAAHLKLSDSLSESNQSSGIAATPKLVKEVNDKINKYTDETTNVSYELGINNGLLYIRQK